MTVPGATISAAMNLALLRGMAIAEIARAFGGGQDPAPSRAGTDNAPPPTTPVGTSPHPVDGQDGTRTVTPAFRLAEYSAIGPQRHMAAQWLTGLTPPRPMHDVPMLPSLSQNATVLGALDPNVTFGTPNLRKDAATRPGMSGQAMHAQQGMEQSTRPTAAAQTPATDPAGVQSRQVPTPQQAAAQPRAALHAQAPGMTVPPGPHVPPLSSGAATLPQGASAMAAKPPDTISVPPELARTETGMKLAVPLPGLAPSAETAVAPRQAEARHAPPPGGAPGIPSTDAARFAVASQAPLDTGVSAGTPWPGQTESTAPMRSDGGMRNGPVGDTASAPTLDPSSEAPLSARTPDARPTFDLPPPAPDAPRSIQVLHTALSAAITESATFGAFPFMAEGRSGNAASMVIFNAAMIPSWPPALRFDQAMGGENALRLGGAALAGMTPEQAAEYIAKMAAGFDFLLKVKKRLSMTAAEEKELLLGLFSFLGAALDALVRGLRMAVEHSLHEEAMLAEVRVERDRKQSRRGRQRLDL